MNTQGAAKSHEFREAARSECREAARRKPRRRPVVAYLSSAKPGLAKQAAAGLNGVAKRSDCEVSRSGKSFETRHFGVSRSVTR